MRALVAGVEAVLPDGSVHNGLVGLKKDNRGYSLDQLLIGAEGTLGVVTAVALAPRPGVADRARRLGRRRQPGARARAAALPRSAHDDASKGSSSFPRTRSSSCSSTSPDTRAPLAGNHPWHVLIEATTADTGHDIAAEIERLLAAALGRA